MVTAWLALTAQSVSTWSGSARPQDTLTVNVLAQMVTALNTVVTNGNLSRGTFWEALNTGELPEINPEEEAARLEKDQYQAPGGTLPKARDFLTQPTPAAPKTTPPAE